MAGDQILSSQSTKLLCSLHQRFSKPASHNLTDFMFEYGSVQDALLYARLFVPEFKIIAGRVILDDGYAAAAYMKAVSESEMGLVDPDSFNWVEVFPMFANSDTGEGNDDYKDDEILAELIVDAWRGRLLTLFPERTFVVEVISREKTGYVVGVGFKEITG